MIHGTAIVSKKAKLGNNIKVGPFTIIDDDVETGDNCEIGPRVHLNNGTRLGNNNYVGEGTLIADSPQDLKYGGAPSYVSIGDNNVIREYVTIHKSASKYGTTKIGSNNFIMAMAHIAHDCVVGNSIIIVNYAGLSGHVTVDDFAFVSGLTAIHQGVRIGGYSMIGGGSKVSKDVMPFVLVGHEPLEVYGLNKVGLKRRGFTPDKIKIIEKAYDIFFRKKMGLADALREIEAVPGCPDELKYFTEFARGTKRGITR